MQISRESFLLRPSSLELVKNWTHGTCQYLTKETRAWIKVQIMIKYSFCMYVCISLPTISHDTKLLCPDKVKSHPNVQKEIVGIMGIFSVFLCRRLGFMTRKWWQDIMSEYIFLWHDLEENERKLQASALSMLGNKSWHSSFTNHSSRPYKARLICSVCILYVLVLLVG